MKFFKFILSLFCLFLLMSCQSVQDGLSGKKRNDTDEFLVEKKNPLVLPPEFDNLPMPAEEETASKKEEEDDNDSEFKIKKILGNTNSKTDNGKISKSLDNSLGKSILRKIKKN